MLGSNITTVAFGVSSIPIITPFSVKKLESECFGGTSEGNQAGWSLKSMEHNMKNAYMLVYERELKMPIKKVMQEVLNEKKAAVLECDNSAPTRAAVGNIYHDPDRKEYYTFVDFHGVEPKVPAKLYQEVWEDNTNFLFEKQIYSAEFFDFVQDVLLESYSLLPTVVPDLRPQIEGSATRIAAKIILGVLAHAYHNSLIKPLTKQLRLLFSQSQVASQEFLAYILQDNMFEVMYILNKCPDRDARVAVKDLLSGAVLACLPHEGTEYTKFDVEKHGTFRLPKYRTNLGTVLHYLIRGISNELAQNWMRFDQYFELLLEILKGGDAQLRTYMNSRGLLSALADFYLGSDSPLCDKGERRPTMGNKFRNPTFFPLIDLIYVLAANADLGFVQPQDAKIREKFGLPVKIAYTLEKEAKECFLSRTFLAKTIIEGHSTPDFANLLAFLCYESEPFSRRLIKLLLKGINSDPTQDLRPQLTAMRKVLEISDSLQRLRVEWILGVPALCKAFPQSSAAMGTPSRIKLGLPLLGSIRDSVHEYTSAVLYKSSHDSLLSLIWNHRKTFEIQLVTFVLETMRDIPMVFDYIAALPPPTYQFAKYPDWFRPFIQSYKAGTKTFGMFAVFFDRKKGDTIQQDAMKLLDECEKKWEDKLLHPSADVLVANPPAYIVGQTMGEKIILHEKQDDSVELMVSEIVTQVHESLPTGKDNLAVPEGYFVPSVIIQNKDKPIGEGAKKAAVSLKVLGTEPTVLKFECRNSTLSAQLTDNRPKQKCEDQDEHNRNFG